MRQSGKMNAIGPVDWPALQRRMDQSPRSLAWREAGRWALSSVERHLGRGWLAKYAERGQPIPAELTEAGSDVEALSHLLDLGLRLELLQNVAGTGQVRNTLKTDLRAEVRRHALVQLEVAALAQRAGLHVHLERKAAGTGRPSDVVFGSTGSEVAAEVRVVLPDQLAREGAVYDREISQTLNELAMIHEVVFDGQLTVRLDEIERTQWFGQLAAAAESVAQTGHPETVVWNDEAITVLSMASAEGASFTGPVTRARGWMRTRGILIDKAPQLEAQGGGWLRVDSLDGLFWASDWAQTSLAERTSNMEVFIREAVLPYSSVYGVVLTSGPCWAPELIGCSSRGARGSYGFERSLPMGRGRATFITPLREEAGLGLDQWRGLYDGEAAWLDWALGQVGLPEVAEITA